MLKGKNLLRAIVVALIIFIGGGIVAGYVNNKLAKPHTIQQIEKNIDIQDFTLDKEVVVEKLVEELDLNILDMQLSTQTSIEKGSDSFFGLFKNTKHIKFYANVNYSLDLASLSDEQVRVIDNDITIWLSKPSVEVNINENMTEFKDEQGALILGDLVTTPEEMTYVTSKAKENVIAKALSEENMNEAMNRSEEKITEVINKLTKQNVNIKIIWC